MVPRIFDFLCEHWRVKQSALHSRKWGTWRLGRNHWMSDIKSNPFRDDLESSFEADGGGKGETSRKADYLGPWRWQILGDFDSRGGPWYFRELFGHFERGQCCSWRLRLRFCKSVWIRNSLIMRRDADLQIRSSVCFQCWSQHQWRWWIWMKGCSWRISWKWRWAKPRCNGRI